MARNGIEGAQWLADLYSRVPAVRTERFSELGDEIAHAKLDLKVLERRLSRFPGAAAADSSERILQAKRKRLAELEDERNQLRPLIENH